MLLIFPSKSSTKKKHSEALQAKGNRFVEKNINEENRKKSTIFYFAQIAFKLKLMVENCKCN